ncbi:MAG: DUF5591 domain-containing protein [Candidatus Asgardarchaeia archaeon]
MNKDIYKISVRHAINTFIDPKMCLYNPYEVYKALNNNKKIKEFLDKISNHYIPPKKEILLIYPCSTIKPYYESRSYKILYKTLSKLGNLGRSIHVATISEPFGIVPEECYYDDFWKDGWYDCPGLFEWWCKKYNQPYDREYLEKSIEILSDYVAKFFKKVKKYGCYSKIVAFVRTYSSSLKERYDHTHKRIISKASKKAGIKVDILPPKEVVAKIVKERGRLAWDFQGIAHPIAQDYLLNYLKEVLNNECKV